MILKKGDTGEKVEELQEKLNRFFTSVDLVVIEVDGDFGFATHDAVVEFQETINLLTDGIAGPKTMQALDEAIKKLKPVEKGQDLSKRLECHLDGGHAHLDSSKQRGFKMRHYPIIKLTNGTNDTFHQIVEYLKVETAKRYKKTKDTWCNIYAYDFLSFLWPFLPHFYWKKEAFNKILAGETVEPVYGENVREYSANMLFDWLTNEGEKYHGWERVATAEELQELVNQGHIGVISAKQSDRTRSGHISVVLPMTEEYKQKGYKVLQSQAGINNKKYFDRDWYRNPKYGDFGFFVNRSPK